MYLIFATIMMIKKATITVQGEGIVSVRPNIVTLTIGVRTEHKNVKQAQEENATQSRQLLDALKALGIADQDIETISYTITPQYEYVNDKALLQGYRVEHLYEITVLNVQKAGEVYDIAVTNGANVAKRITFSTFSSTSILSTSIACKLCNVQ